MSVLKDTIYFIKFTVYILRHKWLVFRLCQKEGLTWQGVVHDCDKFRLCTMLLYARCWYGNEDDRKNNESKLFVARERHHKMQPHHWEYWINEQGQPTDMTDEALLELLCDWRAVHMMGGLPPDEFLSINHDILMSEWTRSQLVQGISIPPGSAKTILKPRP